METQVKQSTLSEEKIQATLKGIAANFYQPGRTPLLESPADYGLAFEKVSFPALDGLALEGWYIPCEGSDKLIISNHPMGFSRYGMPSHLEPWKSMYAPTGNDIEVNFLPDYKILHEAGYHVLAYDLRNFGHSAAGNGFTTSGNFEARDVIGSLRYAKTRPELRHLTVGLFGRCLGCNSILFAMQQHPEEFEGVRCLVGPQPLSPWHFFGRELERQGIAERLDDLDWEIKLVTSFNLADLSPLEAAKHVMVPTLVYQVHDDVMTHPRDVQEIFDNIPVAEKKLFWIQGSTRRWDGYLYFQREPAQILDWFTTYMA